MVVQVERIQHLNGDPDISGRYILYWMQQSQRATFNHALEYTVDRANELRLPVLVGFGLTDDYPEANLRHYQFLLEGLAETATALERRGIRFVLRRGSPEKVAIDLAREAALVVCDRGYLRHQRQWRRRLAENAGREVVQVESDVIVPVETASDKAEYAARTIRPKIHRHFEEFLVKLRSRPVKVDAKSLDDIDSLDVSDPARITGSLELDRSVPAVSHWIQGGTHQAKSRLHKFLKVAFAHYADNRNQPQTDDVSHLSPYLHFGQISPIEVVLTTREHAADDDNLKSFIEELVVRRELTQNFAQFTPNYDSYDCLPEWCRKTLAKHARDKREHMYSQRQLEDAQTHDPYWNAAMLEMRHTGYMHNAMRMYWGKKILEWSASPEKAHRILLAINNKYFLDGRDPNSYANINWIFGLHDRPWQERPIYGTVRCMMASGLERKCDITAYVEKVDRLVKEASESETSDA